MHMYEIRSIYLQSHMLMNLTFNAQFLICSDHAYISYVYSFGPFV